MGTLFPPHKPFLYPQFETYRFHSIDPDTDVSAYPLPGSGATQSRVGYNSHHLGFKEVRARIAWNHLAVGVGGRGVYVDTDWNVIGLHLKDDLGVEFSSLGSLPTPIGKSEAAQHPEYPSVIALDTTHWAVATGSGSLYILQTTAPGDAEFKGEWIAIYDLTLPSSPSTSSGSPPGAVPFLIQAAHSVSPNDIRLFLSRAVPAIGGKRPQNTAFELVEISVDPSRRTDVDRQNMEGIAVKWSLQGGDLPYHCQWSGDGWLILSGETFQAPGASGTDTPDEMVVDTPPPAPTPTKKRSAPKRGLGAKSKARREETAPDPEPEDEGEADDRPFSWTQTGDSATIRIPFPLTTTREDLTIDLGTTFVDIALHDTRIPDASPALQAFLKRPRRTFWAEIDLELSTFTFNPKTCVVEVDLAKAGDDTRWPSIFLPEDDDDVDEVPETIPPAQMKAMRELFASQIPQMKEEPSGNHPAIPSLLREEMDYDLEDGEDYGDVANDGAMGDMGGGKIGREVFVGYIKDGHAQWSKSSTTVLSLPLSSPESVAVSEGVEGVIIKSAVDGLLFTPSHEPARQPWDHASTSPAVAFVLSSKRDLRTVRHIIALPSTSDAPPSPKKAKTEHHAQTTVLAFEAGSSSAGQGNLYVYYPPSAKTTAGQGVVTVSGGDRGALLGVGCVRMGEKQVVLALCEKALLVLHGLLQ